MDGWTDGGWWTERMESIRLLFSIKLVYENPKIDESN
jgi:hypothetical protein